MEEYIFDHYKFKQAFRASGRTRQWLAKETGIKYGTLRHYFSKRTPNSDCVLAIARALEVSPTEISSGVSGGQASETKDGTA